MSDPNGRNGGSNGRHYSVSDPAAQNWHVDRRVPVALIWAIVLQTAGLVGAGAVAWSQLQTQVRDLARLERQVERDVGRLDATIIQITAAANQQAVQLGRIEENLGAMRADMRRFLNLWERDFEPRRARP